MNEMLYVVLLLTVAFETEMEMGEIVLNAAWAELPSKIKAKIATKIELNFNEIPLAKRSLNQKLLLG